ncbi:MAG TPA: transposase domain-containing protein [Nakamurella sp.]
MTLGGLIDAVPGDAVDDAVAACGVRERRSDGKLPAHVITYLTLALTLFPDDDYEEVATKVTGSLDRFGCWNSAWSVPTASAITQARKRLGRGMFAELFERTGGPVAGPVGLLADRGALGAARGSFLRRWRLVAIDGFEVDVPDSPGNAEEFGYAGSGANRSAFPKARVVAVAECGTHAFLAAEIDAYQVGERTLAQRLLPAAAHRPAAGRGPRLLLLPGLGHRGRDRRRPAVAGPHPARTPGGAGAGRWHVPVRGHGLGDPRRPPREDPDRGEGR